MQAYIAEQGLEPGDALPSEAELRAKLGVGRTSLREALRELEVCGIVEVRHGHGMFVGNLRMEALRSSLTFHAQIGSSAATRLAQVVEVREALELGLITSLALAGRRPDDELLAELLARMDQQADSGTIEIATDRQFHFALYEPLENPVAARLLEALWDVTGDLIPPLEGQQQEAMTVADCHHSILLAIRAADARGARVAMQSHFLNLRRRLGMDDTTEQA